MADDHQEEEQQEEEGPEEEEHSQEEQSEQEESLEERVKRLEQERSQERNERIKQERIAKRKQNQEDSSIKQETDWGQKAYLVAQGYTDPEEQSVIFKAMERTGDDLESVVTDEFVQGKIQKLRNDREAQEATPDNSGGRSGSPASDSVDYWIERGELPPKDEKPELRKEVVKERRRQAEKPRRFS